VEACIDAELRLGRHAEVVAEVRQLAGAHPLRERLHALLTLSLYRSGQQGEALAACQRARRALIGELGTDPGPELRALVILDDLRHPDADALRGKLSRPGS
jgi:DNA-binding SARP family transcriptional activator